jgi:hypothetical protein
MNLAALNLAALNLAALNLAALRSTEFLQHVLNCLATLNFALIFAACALFP